MARGLSSPPRKRAAVGRLASLDLLRGAAALAVAVPHYFMLGATDQPIFQTVSILAVEVFFVLSGFVLAPQILGCLTSSWLSDTGIFLVRRWMRTIPPYYVALAAITVVSGNILNADVFLYAVYVQNLMHSLAEARDYFAVAWSLSVEEWFYVVFALLVVGARIAGLNARAFVGLVVVFALAVFTARTVFGDMSAMDASWDANVRRVTLFRLDAIAYGFLLHVVLDRMEDFYARFAHPLLTLLAVALVAAMAFRIGWLASVDGLIWARHLYPFAAALLGASLIFALTFHRDMFQRVVPVQRLSDFLGKVSYTIYLFHIVVILLLRPHVAALPVVVQIALYLAALFGFCAFFFYGFERPILLARPHYRGDQPRPRSITPPVIAPAWVRAFRARLQVLPVRAAMVLLAIGGGWLCNVSFHRGQSALFYAALIATTFALIAATSGWSAARNGGPGVLRIGIGLFALTLPLVDLVYDGTRAVATQRPTIETYSFRQAQRDPTAFRAWWSRFTDEFNRGAKLAIEMPDPEGTLPFLPQPGARSMFFDGPIRINSLGFRGEDFPAEKGDAFRIFAIGESPTFGTLPKPGMKAWPDVLQGLIEARYVCRRPVQVINAGVVGYHLGNSIERARRFIAPLKPDVVISYHGFNNLGLVDPLLAVLPQPPHWQRRASPLIGEVLYRFASLRYARRVQNLGLADASHYSDAYDKLYRSLVALGREQGFATVLANLSMVVTAASPAEVIDFYGRTFMPIARIIPAVAEHNRQVEAVAKETGATFIDTTPGLAGEWDADYFYDTVHFTQKGSDMLAGRMLEGLKPLLANAPGCVAK